MTDIPRATLEKLNDGNGLRVEFFWLGDRFGHTIAVVKDGVATIEWKSVDDDPLGPVYQELHEQQTDGGKILFLNGAGNGTHWSASVLFEAEGCLLTFDVAARVREEPLERAIEYRGHFEVKPIITSSHLHDATHRHLDETGKLVLFLTDVAEVKSPVTLRYKYAFQ